MFPLLAKYQTHRRAPNRSTSRGHSRRRPSVLEMLEDRMLPSCTLSLAPSESAPQLVGDHILWSAKATDCGDNPVYQFRVGPSGGQLSVVRDFSPTDNFIWTPMQ